MPTGTIARLLIDKGFGFIRDENGLEHFFHRSSVRGAVFELLRDGQRVEFTPEDSQKGPRAGDVRLIEDGASSHQPAPNRSEPAVVSPAVSPSHGSERGPVALPVFKIGRLPLTAGGLGSTPRRFRHSTRKRPASPARPARSWRAHRPPRPWRMP